jgi:hypothetical protein
MAGMRTVARPAAAAALGLVLALAGCENPLQFYVFDTLFGPPYRREVAKIAPAAPVSLRGNFGQAVDIDGDYLIVGQPTAAGNMGAAVIYHRTGVNSWGEPDVSTLTAPEPFDYFGTSVSISGEWAVVGGPGRSVTGKTSAGMIVILRRAAVGNTWNEVQTFDLAAISQGPESNDRFGYSVATNGSWIAVGARQDDLGDADLNKNYGAVYLFENVSGIWTYATRLDQGAVQAKESANFGISVDMVGNLLVVGAHYEDVDGYGVGGIKHGAAYVYRFEIDSWLQSDRLTASDSESDAIFGASVSIWGDYAVVGSPWKDEGGQANAGAAYVFQRSTATDWHTIVPQKIVLGSPADNDWLGLSVAVCEDNLVAGAPYRDASGSGTGAAYLYARSTANQWNWVADLAASDAESALGFGWSLSVGGTFAAVGSTDQALVDGEGAVYLFK